MSTAARKRLIRDFKREPPPARAPPPCHRHVPPAERPPPPLRPCAAGLQQDPPEGVNASPQAENIMQWNAIIFGPDGTVWDGGVFKLTMEFSEDYPNKAPVVKFRTRMFHPNSECRPDRVFVGCPSPLAGPLRRLAAGGGRWQSCASAWPCCSTVRPAVHPWAAGSCARQLKPMQCYLAGRRQLCLLHLLALPAVATPPSHPPPACPPARLHIAHLPPPQPHRNPIHPLFTLLLLLPLPLLPQSMPTGASAWTSCRTSGAPSMMPRPSSPPSSPCCQTPTQTHPPTQRQAAGWPGPPPPHPTLPPPACLPARPPASQPPVPADRPAIWCAGCSGLCVASCCCSCPARPLSILHAALLHYCTAGGAAVQRGSERVQPAGQVGGRSQLGR